MKCIILKHDWLEADNGNLYCQCLVREDGDEWATSFKYNFFCTEDVKEAMEAKFPKYIYLKEVNVPTPAKFNRAWLFTENGHNAGEIVGREINGTFVPTEFKSIKVIIRALPNGDAARGEDAEKMMLRTWNRGIADGSIIPIDEDEPEDVFAGTMTADDEPEVVDSPTNLPTNGGGNGNRAANRPNRILK